MTFLEVQLKHLSTEHQIAFELEYRFHSKRKWRFDVAFPDLKVAAEIDGGVWTQGRHTRGKGFINDQEKTNEAQLLDWKVYRFVPADLENGIFLDVLDRAIVDAKIRYWGGDKDESGTSRKQACRKTGKRKNILA